MELYTLINKETNQLIRFNKIDIDDDLGILYYFSEDEYLPIWITTNINDIDYLLSNNLVSIPPIYSINYNKPSNEYVNLKNYKPLTFKTE